MAAQETLLNGRYRLIAQQGSGGMAVIYKAQDLALGRTVAIKVLRPSLTGDPSFLTRFRQEARNVANLAHPNIVTLYDVGQDGNTYYMVMEYIEGQDLKKLIRASAPFTIERMLHIGIQLCAGVGYAHRAGLVHADVKPQNILITADDQVKVTDFGIAQALSLTQPEEKQSVVWGSPHYFAPEQASGEAPTPASDVYAIGIVMFEMLTGKLPYSGADQQELALAHIREQVPHVMELNPSVPVHLDRIIYKVMAKEPASRYRTADQLGRILISYQKQGQDVTSNVPYPGPTPNQTGVPAPGPSAPAAPAPARQTPAQPRFFTGNTPPPQAPYVQQPAPGQYLYGGTPPPQAPYAQPGTGSQNRVGTGSMPPANPANPFSKPATGPFAPPNTGPYAPDGTGQRRAPNYQVPAPPSPIDVVSIVLAFIAFLAVLGLLPLWLAVWNTWTSAPR
jgi:eukaryotic-like serine/threonine-protein kinase